ncbi:hypothetical protein HYU94_01270 [Candidatus Daviesbacteria bacterium]|nr:hypothetical protein [Candidatus Daviesbacteria bacterium]
MDQTLAIILKDTYSLTQLKSRLRILKSSLLKTFFGGSTGSTPGESPSTSLGTSGPIFEVNILPQDLNWLKSLPENFYRQFNKDNVYKIFTELEAQIPKLPILTMYLVFEPDFMSLGQIGATVRKTFVQPTLLLDIKLNPGLIAGIALVWKGIYKDYSVKAKIEQRKEEILQGFKRFLR